MEKLFGTLKPSEYSKESLVEALLETQLVVRFLFEELEKSKGHELKLIKIESGEGIKLQAIQGNDLSTKTYGNL